MCLDVSHFGAFLFSPPLGGFFFAKKDKKMNTIEKQIIYSAVLRLANSEEELTPAERRDVINELCRGLCDMSLDEILNKTENQRKLRIKRGGTNDNDEYVGLAGEITMDTDAKTIRIHDGETTGGVAMAKKSEIPPEFHFPFPDFSAEVNIGAAAGATFVLPCDALVCVRVGGSSCLAVKKDNANGTTLFYQENTNNNTVLASMILPKDTNLYILRRSGTYAHMSYYPMG